MKIEDLDYLFVQYEPLFKNVIKKYGYNRNYDDCHGICIDVLLKCVHNYKEGRVSFGAYLKRSLHNRFIDEIRVKKETVSIDIPKISENLKSDEDLENYIFSSEKKDLVNKLITSLTKFEREIIMRFFFDNLSLSEIAILTGKSYQTIANTKTKAIKKMRNQCKLAHLTYFDFS